jgi:hypothetical protein
MGTTYTFKVSARNAYGMSLYSTELEVLAAQTPSKLSAPTTIVNGNDVDFVWTEPSDGGSEITSYTILIQKDDGNFITETTYCDGTVQVVIDALSCSIPIATLR